MLEDMLRESYLLRLIVKPIREHEGCIWSPPTHTCIRHHPCDKVADRWCWGDVFLLIEELIDDPLGLFLDCCSPCGYLCLDLKMGHGMAEGAD